ncbi:WecB/TagA/CpsF family glycosyltransferase [Dysgonomonas sp. Marseille-P4677]|uniref:WecB/TagA/CpsF family glycosyltransferase n=1 Tax=Dysgonomonas sp. Marseille-P4677 TaxID=2364790 RepID=UPI0019128D32|nr:WecB/TagA/CpsF family glycosyltransferase [Dysgonomonas sp. Marseille-P4677]MBK5719445.1 WecB/TagA/CpsF family glycosyltransferase [Dysgonomonas sp. Marseille-P4677]
MQDRNRIDFLNIPIDTLTMQETINKIDSTLQRHQSLTHVVVNAGKVVAMQSNKELHESVVNCDLINADGQSIVWAARFLGKYIPERVSGIDLMENLVKMAYERKYKCFFFGAKEEVVSKVVQVYTNKYSKDIIAGYKNGYYVKEDELYIAQQIAQSNADLLFVAITSPKKEIFLDKYRDILSSVGFTMGVGGSFDVIAGYTARAPIWMQKIGMEWFFRLIQEPRRMWRRYIIGNYKFIELVIKERINIGK